MIVKQFVIEGYESNCFIVACPETKAALVVDPGKFESRAVRFLETEGLTLKYIVVTHGHYDHVGGVDEFLGRFGGEVLSGGGDAGGGAGRRVADGEPLALGRLTGQFLHVPGHTEDSICLRLASAVFTGDALFAGAIGGTTSPEQKARLMSGLKAKVLSLPDDTRLYTGHGAPTTVKIEKTASPFFAPPRSEWPDQRRP